MTSEDLKYRVQVICKTVLMISFHFDNFISFDAKEQSGYSPKSLHRMNPTGLEEHEEDFRARCMKNLLKDIKIFFFLKVHKYVHKKFLIYLLKNIYFLIP